MYKGQNCRLILYLFCFHFHSKSSTVLPCAFIAKEKILKAIANHCRIVIFFFKSVVATETVHVPSSTSVAFLETDLLCQ